MMDWKIFLLLLIPLAMAIVMAVRSKKSKPLDPESVKW